MEILRQPALLPNAPSIDEELKRFEDWLIHIFSLPLDDAQRRNREMHGKWYIESRLKLDKKANRYAIQRIKKEKLRKAFNMIKSKLIK